MKKVYLSVTGLVLLVALAYGVVKTYVIDAKTVSSPQEILKIFYETRRSLPPLPSTIDYQDVMGQLAGGRADFIAAPGWAFPFDGGTYYLSEKAAFSKKLRLPAKLLAYEDLASGKVVLAGIPAASEKLVSLAVVDAPAFAPFDEKSSVENYLMKELWPRRVVWTATLKPEADAWNDLVVSRQATSLSVAPMMMSMSAPEQVSGFVVVQDGTNISVNLPEEFAGADITLERSTNLVAGGWVEVLQTNAQQSGTLFLAYADIPDLVSSGSGSTNSGGGTIPPPGGSNTNSGGSGSASSGGTAFYRAGAYSTVDTDGDGLDNVSEYGAGSDYLWKDTSGDGLLDGWLVQYGFNPLALNSLGDSDHDGYSNLEEQEEGTDPTQANSSGNTGTVATIRYYYDEDDRMTDFFCGSEVAQKTILSTANNISEEVSAK